MKYYLLLLMCLTTLNSLNADQSAEEAKNAQLEQFFDLVAKCREKYPGTSDERIRLILKHLSVPKSKNEKCAASCVMTNSGLIVDGMIGVPGWKQISLIKYNDPKIAALAGETAEYCYDKVKENDPCELAASTMSCIIERSKEMNIPPPDVPK